MTLPGFACLAQVGPNLLLAGMTGFGSFINLGLGAAALIAFISRATDPRYTAAHYVLLSSLAAVPRTVIVC